MCAQAAIELALRDRGPDPLMQLARRLTREDSAAFALGVMLHGAAGAAWGFGAAFVSAIVGWPVLALEGALLGAGRWALAERLVPVRPRNGRARLVSLAAHVAFGAVFGATYQPGR